MTRMFSMIFVILFFFIMVLCAFQPICFADATTTDYKYVLTTETTQINTGKFYLMLDKYTPLTLRYFKENPDYNIQLHGDIAGFKILCEADPTTTGIFNCGAYTDSTYIVNYASVSAWVYVYEKEDILLDSPLYVMHAENGANTVYQVCSAWNYEVPLLDRLAVVGNEVFKNSQTLINFIIKYPLLLISFGLLLVSSIIAITKRVITVG